LGNPVRRKFGKAPESRRVDRLSATEAIILCITTSSDLSERVSGVQRNRGDRRVGARLFCRLITSSAFWHYGPQRHQRERAPDIYAGPAYPGNLLICRRQGDPLEPTLSTRLGSSGPGECVFSLPTIPVAAARRGITVTERCLWAGRERAHCRLRGCRGLRDHHSRDAKSGVLRSPGPTSSSTFAPIRADDGAPGPLPECGRHRRQVKPLREESFQ
jgi:hypothetical protein